MVQYCFARWRLSSVVVCNAAGGWAGRSGGRHSTAGQYCYVPLGRHLVLFGVDSNVMFNADLIIKCDVHERILNTLLLPFYQSYVSADK